MTKTARSLDRTIQQLPLKNIIVRDRLRSIDPDHAAWMARSMADNGQQQPIVVSAESKTKAVLVAGGHRLEAARQLGWETIAAVFEEGTPTQLRLIEIDENLARRDLTALDRAVVLEERKRLYEQLHPETKQGGDRKSGKADQTDTMTVWSDTDKGAPAFAPAVAEKLGLEERTIRRAVQIAKALSADQRAALSGHPVADNQAGLLKLAKLEPAKRQEVIDALTRDDNPVNDLALAIASVDRRPKAREAPAWDRAYQQLYASFGRAPAKAKKTFLNQLLEDGSLNEIIAQAKGGD